MKNTTYTIEHHNHVFEESRKRVKNGKTGKMETKIVKSDPDTTKGFMVIEVSNPSRGSIMPGTWLNKNSIMVLSKVSNVTIKSSAERRY